MTESKLISLGLFDQETESLFLILEKLRDRGKELKPQQANHQLLSQGDTYTHETAQERKRKKTLRTEEGEMIQAQ